MSEHGSLADEAARLVDAFGQVAAGWSRGAGDTARGSGTAHPAPCLVCPWCQVVARVQESRPEVVAHLTDAASSLAAALADLAGSRVPATAPRPARDNVQHIDISD